MTDSETGAQPVAPTVLLYQTDSYVREFDARVVAVEGSAVALEQTAFYPGGGGQMADRGTLTIAGQAIRSLACARAATSSGTSWTWAVTMRLRSAPRFMARWTGTSATR